MCKIKKIQHCDRSPAEHGSLLQTQHEHFWQLTQCDHSVLGAKFVTKWAMQCHYSKSPRGKESARLSDMLLLEMAKYFALPGPRW